jgi:hypothetical protein
MMSVHELVKAVDSFCVEKLKKLVAVDRKVCVCHGMVNEDESMTYGCVTFDLGFVACCHQHHQHKE